MTMLNLDKLGKLKVKAAGVTAEIDPGTYPEETVLYWTEYGIRRAYQDRINSAAKALRDAQGVERLHEKDAEGIFEATDKMFRDATMGQRGSGAGSAASLDPVTALAFKNAKADILAVLKARVDGNKLAELAASDLGAKYLTDTGVWKDEAVADFIARNKASGKRDYQADAEATLDADI